MPQEIVAMRAGKPICRGQTLPQVAASCSVTMLTGEEARARQRGFQHPRGQVFARHRIVGRWAMALRGHVTDLPNAWQACMRGERG